MKNQLDLKSMLPLCMGILTMIYARDAYAHAETGVAGGLLSGFLHPVFGVDHLIAMVAVGLWGAQLGSPAIWILPITFPVVMACGALLGVAGVPVPAIEEGVSASAIILGLMIAFALKPPFWAAAMLVAAFAVFHGYAHGAELPAAVNPMAYGVGFVVSTGLLHLCGILLGILIRWPMGAMAIRVSGGSIAVAGAYFLVVTLGLLP